MVPGDGAPEGQDELRGQLGVGTAPDAVGAEPGAGTPGYRFEYWGALRAFFRPYFLDSFSRASRVRKPAFLSAAAELGVELAQGPGDAESEGAGLAGDAAAVDGDVDVPRLGGSVSRRGSVTIIRWVAEVKYSSNVWPLQVMRPGRGGCAPGRRPACGVRWSGRSGQSLVVPSLGAVVGGPASAQAPLRADACGGPGDVHRDRGLGGVRVLLARGRP